MRWRRCGLRPSATDYDAIAGRQGGVGDGRGQAHRPGDRAAAGQGRRQGGRSTTRGSKAEAEATAAECGGAPIFQANLEKVADIERLFGDVEAHFGRIDGLVNNAARFTRIDPLKVTEADWDFIHSVNLKATFFCCPAGGGNGCWGSGGGAHCEHQFAGGDSGVAGACALLRVEGRGWCT